MTRYLVGLGLLGCVATATATAEEPEPTGSSFAAVFEAVASLRAVSVFEVDPDECANATRRAWIVSSSRAGKQRAASCIGDGHNAPRCLDFAGYDHEHLVHALCEQSSVTLDDDAPAWSTELLSVVAKAPADIDVSVSPVGAGVDALWVRSLFESEHYLGVWSEGAWMWTPLVFPGDASMYPRVEVLDTTPVTATPSFGIVTEAYDGGSGQGQQRTAFALAVPKPGTLEEVVRFAIGELFWAWSPDEKRPTKTLRDRPHVEVQLTPVVREGALELRVDTHSVAPADKKRFACTPEEAKLGDLDCPLTDIAAIRDAAGVWKWNGRTLVRR